MDHKSFETNMIDFVNRNAKAEEEIRNEHLREERESIAQQKRKKVTMAVIELILWFVALFGVVTVMSIAHHINLIVSDIAVPASSLFAYIAGVRINTLATRISKYGGRS